MSSKMLVGAVAALATAAPALANSVAVSMTYDDLNGTFSKATRTFTAAASATKGNRSSGDVSRLIGATPTQIGNAAFTPGFVSDPGMADFVLTMTVGGLEGDGTRSGVGSFTATDLDGDTITGTINGRWASSGGTFADFVGTLSDVTFTGGFFNGQIGDGWDMTGLTDRTWSGALVALSSNVGNFFNADFADATTGLTGQVIIPLPPAAWAGIGMLGILGTGTIVRRRRLLQQ